MGNIFKRIFIFFGDLFGLITLLAALFAFFALVTGAMANMVQGVGFLILFYCVSGTCHRMAVRGDFNS